VASRILTESYPDGGAVNANFSQGYQWFFTGNPPAAGIQVGYKITDWLDLKFRVQNGIFRLCDRIVCNSRSAADRLRDAGIAERTLTVIPNGLPNSLFAAVTSDPVHDPQVVRIGMISRMNDSVKRHDLFLRAAKRLAERFPQVRFVLVGDGPLRAGLEALANQLALIACLNAEISNQTAAAELRFFQEGYLQIEPCPQTTKRRERIIP